MELLLWRHAEAEDGPPDLERRLTPRGRKQAKRMAGWLDPRLPGDALILASPALRSQETARALGRSFRIVEGIAPGVSADAFLEAIGWPDAGGCVLAVGHQPTLGEVAALLLSGRPGAWSVRKGALWWLAARARPGAPKMLLRACLEPDLA